MNDRTLPSDNSLRHRKQLSKHDKKINSILGSCGFGLFDPQLILTLNSFFSTKSINQYLPNFYLESSYKKSNFLPVLPFSNYDVIFKVEYIEKAGKVEI